MSLLTNNTIVNFYNLVFTEFADPRTNHWFLISSPIPGLTLLGLYWYFVKSWGPRFMENRKPFQLKNTLIVYNFLQVLVSLYLIYEGLDAAWLKDYSWKCQPVDFSDNPDSMRVARGVYLYFLAKISELMDTVFFVLRKKDRQVTFLHMYHHTVMPMISWGATKYFPGGHGTLIGVINSFVHVIMYSYYMFAAMGPQFQKYLWWKKHITTMQMLQFCIQFLHNAQLLFYDCGFPRWSVCLTMPNTMFFYFLFADFYRSAYNTCKSQFTGRSVANGKIANGKTANSTTTNGTTTNGTITNGTITNGTITNGTITNDTTELLDENRNGIIKDIKQNGVSTQNGFYPDDKEKTS